MREWRALAHRHRLEMHFRWDQILAVSLQLVSYGFPMPSNLDEVNLSELHAMASLSPFTVVFRAVWPSDRAAFATLSYDGEYLAPANELFAKDDRARAIRRHSAQCASSGPIAVRTKRKLRDPRSFPRWAPRSGYAYWALPLYFLALVTAATHANFLKQVKGSLPGMESASR